MNIPITTPQYRT